MSADSPRICLFTPGHIASTPRLVKEADALVEAGYAVHVLAGRHFPPADQFDAHILAGAKWEHTLVDWTRGPGVFTRKIARRLARQLISRTPFVTVDLAARAHHAETLRFAGIAARIPARLYHGHCLAALPVAVLAAQRRGALCGFDIEDYHDAETEISAADPADRIAVRVLQQRLLRKCAVLTNAAPLIGRNVAKTYGMSSLTLLNVFPRAEAPAESSVPHEISVQRPARFYWFSQTIGPGRGLEAAVKILARMRTPAELHLRGVVSPGYVARLQELAAAAGFLRPIKFHPPAAANEMARLAAEADMGLSTEESQPLNRDVCLTNKIFTYLLAGIPQLLSRTSAQTALAPDLGEAALLCALDDPADAAHRLDGFFSDQARVCAARKTARDLARLRYCWDVEKKSFLDLVGRQLGPPC